MAQKECCGHNCTRPAVVGSFCHQCHDSKNNQRIAQRKRNREFILCYLKTHVCVDCGESNPLLLEFDHVRGTKSGHISFLVSLPRPLETIKNEIKKCDVRCTNCHRIKTRTSNPLYYKLISCCLDETCDIWKLQPHRISKIFILNYLKEHHCVDCGESNPIVLEFDHRNPLTKSAGICYRRTIPFLISEIAKCDVRCANCHKIKTLLKNGSYKNRVSESGKLSESTPLDL